MDRLNLQRLIWACHRLYLIHGVSMVVVVCGLLTMAGLLIGAGRSHLRIAEVDRNTASLIGELRHARQTDAPRQKVQELPLPATSRRFAINRRILETLKKAGFEPERVRFKFEGVHEAGLTRQVTVFTLKARWVELAKTLAQLQASDRSLYISRLRLSRENADDEQVSAEVQLAVALVDAAQPEAGQ